MNVEDIFVFQESLLHRFVDGQCIAVGPSGRDFFHFNQLGSEILRHMAGGNSIATVTDLLLETLPPGTVDRPTLLDDVAEFTQQSLSLGVLHRHEEPPAEVQQLDSSAWHDDLLNAGAELNRPLWAKIEIARRCHLQCRHCYIPADQRQHSSIPVAERAAEDFSFDELSDLLDQLAELGTILVTFTGGEIFLRKDMEDIVRAASDRGFAVELITSATPLTAARIERLSESRLSRVQVSVYSHRPEVHDRFTGSKGAFQRSLAAMRLLSEHGLTVELACTILPENHSELTQIAELAESVGARCSWGYPITAQTDGNLQPHQMRLDERQLRSVVETIPEFFALPPQRGPERRICGAGVSMLSIDAAGNVLPCSQFQLPAGNVRSRRLAEIWQSSEVLQRVRSLRYGDLKTPRASDAQAAYVGLCPGLNLLEEGDFLIPAQITSQTTQFVNKLLNESDVAEELRSRLQAG